MLLWQGSIVEIDHGFFRVVGPYFIGKSLGTLKILIFRLWSFIRHPYPRTYDVYTPLFLNIEQKDTCLITGASTLGTEDLPIDDILSCMVIKYCYNDSIL